MHSAPPTPIAIAIGMLLAGACTSTSKPYVAPARNGLIPVAQIRQPTPGPHLAQIAALDDRWVYIANSNDVLAVYELTASDPARWAGPEDPLATWPFAGEPQGQPGLQLRLDRAAGTGEVRCTSLAVHAPTRSLFCGSDDQRGVRRFDLAAPDQPILDPIAWQPELLFLRDLAVVGDHLYLARFDQGLSRAAIDGAGQLGALEALGIGANVRRLAGDEQGRVWALTSDHGLIVVEPSESGVSELAAIELAGPALDLAVHGREAIVGLGSAGARVFELTGAGALEVREQFEPPGVVSAVDLREDVAAVVTLTGAWLFDRRSDPPRWAGFRSAGAWDFGERTGSMLYARFIADDLLVSDWNWIERFAIDPEGEPTGIDLQRAVYVASEDAEVQVALRNVSGLDQRVEVYSVGGEQLESFMLAPFAVEIRRYPAERFEIDVPELLTFVVYQGEGVVAQLSTTVLRRPPAADWPVEVHGKPAPGQRFPSVAIGVGSIETMSPLWLPVPERAQRVVFYGADCVAMWPELEDLIWRSEAGDFGEGRVVLAGYENVFTDGVLDRWVFGSVPWGVFGPDYLGSALIGLNPWVELYEQGFGLHELPSAAYHPTDYELDDQGRVIAVEREYRGRYPLFAAAFE